MRVISKSPVTPGKTLSELSKYNVTEALWEGFLPREPAKIRSSKLFALIVFLLNLPNEKHRASIILDLPAPFGPTMHVNPLESLIVTVRSPKDLKPLIEIFLI
jgi:hypothetical protein